jgi:ribosomal-protein-alanine N-acetyltransferase
MANEFPVLTTDRLLLRQIDTTDATVVLAGYSNPQVNKFMSVAYYTLNEVQDQLNWYRELRENGRGNWWGICLRGGVNIMIGNGGFNNWRKEHKSIEIGYWILPEFHGKGYATEAVNAMCNFAFEHLDIHRVEAIVESDNEASKRMLSKLHFTDEGVRRQCEIKNGRYIDLCCFAKFNPAH